MGVKRIVLLGAGGHAKVVWDSLSRMRDENAIQVVAVLDDDARLWGKAFMNLTVQGAIHEIAQVQAEAAVIAVGDNAARRRVYETVKALGIPLLNVIHPSAVIGADVQLGDGIVAFANVVVNVGSRIGDNVILNTACTVDHDCVIGAHAHIAPGVHLAGGVSIGEGTLMGIASSAIPLVDIGRWVTVGAGSVVVRNIPDNVTIAGIPARILEQ
jgi:sugar O-acyltransferase (sialic acid O-acetyltransferase NeuD family)